jgi:hypothetical protein
VYGLQDSRKKTRPRESEAKSTAGGLLEFRYMEPNMIVITSNELQGMRHALRDLGD